MHQSSLDKMTGFREKYLASRQNEPLRILDLGSLDVNGSYKPLFDTPAWTYNGVDMAAGDNVDIVLKDPYAWREIRSESVDILISGQAFEHIEFFWIAILEVTRVLKPGGLCCLIAPSGGFEHRYPVDCWRFYPDGFTAMARFGRLNVLEVSTQWTADPRYTQDDSNRWQDTMMVCTKPRLSGFGSWRRRLRLALLHKMMSMRL
ncbi:class I SAM-dependent methyltransferase [Desulfonema ishimotonii]|uniref:Class I SAM-dependent methyltransferase n=1 Tax=Desulfonema ishimotonii TaxID=45657 RepID=A0A401FUP1_9BACT|nr:methyltransferase domain-containing protein [Desulfonema ishimotonii]GBC60664.1 class I SAM-dependent methyltransferase [Desulfonema ishimotonii]